MSVLGFPGDSVVKNLPANAGDTGVMGLIPRLEWEMQPTPVFLPGKFHGWRGLAGHVVPKSQTQLSTHS